jgi:hypothetical protein
VRKEFTAETTENAERIMNRKDAKDAKVSRVFLRVICAFAVQ